MVSKQLELVRQEVVVVPQDVVVRWSRGALSKTIPLKIVTGDGAPFAEECHEIKSIFFLTSQKSVVKCNKKATVYDILTKFAEIERKSMETPTFFTLGKSDCFHVYMYSQLRRVFTLVSLT